MNPTKLLSMDNATLHSINTEEAIFCISKQGVRVTDSSVGPFLWSSGFLNAEQLAIVPLHHLHTLASQSVNLLEPNLQIAVIHMTGRCGSTLLCQMLEKVPSTLVLSEPLVISFPAQDVSARRNIL